MSKGTEFLIIITCLIGITVGGGAIVKYVHDNTLKGCVLGYCGAFIKTN